MARNQRQLTVEFKGDTTDLVHAADASEKALTGVGKSASGPGGLLSKLTPVVDPISLVTQGLSALVSTGLDFAEAAIADSKSAAALDGVLQKVTKSTHAQVDATEDWITNLSLAVGIADDELRPAMARLVAATGNVSTAQSDLSLALDIAAGTGKDFNAVADAMVKAQNGNVGGLGRMGLATKDASGKQLDLNTILDNARAKWGGLAEKVADTDPINKMSVAWQELQEQLGQFVVPLLVFLADIVTKYVMPAVMGFVNFIKQNWPQVFAIMKPSLDQLSAAFASLAHSLDPLVGSGPNDQSGSMWLQINAVRLLTAVSSAAAATIGFLASIVRGLASDVSAAVLLYQLLANELTGPMVRAVSTLWSAFAGFGSDVVDIAISIQHAFEDVFHWIAKAWNATIGKLSFHIPGTSIGFDVPDLPTSRALGAVPASSGSFSAPSSGGITVNLPPGSDGHAVVSALRTYGYRAGGLDLTAAATR